MLEPVPIIGMYFLGFAVVWLGILAVCCVAGIIGRQRQRRTQHHKQPTDHSQQSFSHEFHHNQLSIGRASERKSACGSATVSHLTDLRRMCS